MHLRSSRFHVRVRETAQLFGLTRIFVEYQRSCWELQSIRWENADRPELLGGLDLIRRCLGYRNRLIRESASIAGGSGNLRHVNDLTWVFKYDSVGSSLAAIAMRLETIASDGKEDRDIISLWESWNRFHQTSTDPVTFNGIFTLKADQFSRIEHPEIWHHQFMDSSGTLRHKAETDSGYIVENVRRGHVYRLFRAKAGNFYLGRLDLETSQSPTGEVYLEMDFFSSEHERLNGSPRSRISPTGLYGEKQRIRVLWQAPENTAYGRIKIRFYEMDQASRVFLDQLDILDLGTPSP
jgi:hypothetical protein